MEKYLKDTLSELRLKEVERIENTEIILPIVKLKRDKIDLLKKDRLNKIKLKAQSPSVKKPMPAPTKNKAITQLHKEAVKPRNEEQVI
jgi:hypothetical protein